MVCCCRAGAMSTPKLYRTDAGPILYSVDAERDRAEISLAQWSHRDDMPMLGICRGIQVINVAMGGTLWQDIPSESGSTLRHRHPA